MFLSRRDRSIYAFMLPPRFCEERSDVAISGAATCLRLPRRYAPRKSGAVVEKFTTFVREG